MAEEDELEMLRAVDPVDVGDLPHPGGLEARALFERITMTDTEVAPTETPTPAPVPPNKRPLALAAVAAAIVLIGAVAAFALTRPATNDAPDENTPAGSDAPISPGGGMALCIEMYDLETLPNRDVAFAGTVKSIDGDKVTFSVDEAFKGVTGDEVTLEGAQGLSGLTSASEGVTLEPGAKMLVSGDDGFVWTCGFTQPYDAEVAAQWKAALAG